MKLIFKNIIPLFILLAFLVSTNGMLVYHHFCACNQKSYIALMVDRDCCTGMNQNTKCENESCCHSIKHHADKEIQNPESCKKDIAFYKILNFNNSEYSNISIRIFSPEIFNTIANYFPSKNLYSSPPFRPPIVIPKFNFQVLFNTFLI